MAEKHTFANGLPKDKMRVGILGLGRGLTHLKSFLAIEEAAVIGACDRVPRLRDRAREQIDAAGTTAPLLEEFDELLALGPAAKKGLGARLQPTTRRSWIISRSASARK